MYICVANGSMVIKNESLELGVISCWSSGVPRNFFRGVQQIQLRTEDKEEGELGAVAP